MDERSCPLPLARYAAGADGTGYPRPQVTHHPHTQPWVHPGARPAGGRGFALSWRVAHCDRPCDDFRAAWAMIGV